MDLNSRRAKSFPSTTKLVDAFGKSEDAVRAIMRTRFMSAAAPTLSRDGATAGLPRGTSNDQITSARPDKLGSSRSELKQLAMHAQATPSPPALTSAGRRAGISVRKLGSNLASEALATSVALVRDSARSLLVSSVIPPTSSIQDRAGLTAVGSATRSRRGDRPVAQDRVRWASGTMVRLGSAARGLNVPRLDQRGRKPLTKMGALAEGTECLTGCAGGCDDGQRAASGGSSENVVKRELDKQQAPSLDCPPLLAASKQPMTLALDVLSSAADARFGALGVGTIKGCGCSDCGCDEKAAKSKTADTNWQALANLTPDQQKQLVDYSNLLALSKLTPEERKQLVDYGNLQLLRPDRQKQLVDYANLRLWLQNSTEQYAPPSNSSSRTTGLAGALVYANTLTPPRISGLTTTGRTVTTGRSFYSSTLNGSSLKTTGQFVTPSAKPTGISDLLVTPVAIADRPFVVPPPPLTANRFVLPPPLTVGSLGKSFTLAGTPAQYTLQTRNPSAIPVRVFEKYERVADSSVVNAVSPNATVTLRFSPARLPNPRNPTSYESLITFDTPYDLPSSKEMHSRIGCLPVRYTSLSAPSDGSIDTLGVDVQHPVRKAIRIVHGSCWKRVPWTKSYLRPPMPTEVAAMKSFNKSQQLLGLPTAPIPTAIHSPGIFPQVSDQILKQVQQQLGAQVRKSAPEVSCGDDGTDCVSASMNYDLAQPQFSSEETNFASGVKYATEFAVNLSGVNAGALDHRIATTIANAAPKCDFPVEFIPGFNEFCTTTLQFVFDILGTASGLAGTALAEVAVLMELLNSHTTIDMSFSLDAGRNGVGANVLSHKVVSSAPIGASTIEESVDEKLKPDCKGKDCAINQIVGVFAEQAKFPLSNIRGLNSACPESDGTKSATCFGNVLTFAQALDRVTGVSPSNAQIVMSALSKNNFECQKNSCVYVPRLLAINILPEELEVVLAMPPDDGTLDNLGILYQRLTQAGANICDPQPLGSPQSGYVSTWASGSLLQDAPPVVDTPHRTGDVPPPSSSTAPSPSPSRSGDIPAPSSNTTPSPNRSGDVPSPSSSTSSTTGSAYPCTARLRTRVGSVEQT